MTRCSGLTAKAPAPNDPRSRLESLPHVAESSSQSPARGRASTFTWLMPLTSVSWLVAGFVTEYTTSVALPAPRFAVLSAEMSNFIRATRPEPATSR